MFEKLKDLVKAELKEWRDPQAEEVPMSCPEITIESVDPALYSRLLAEANAAGAQFDGDKVSMGGIELKWNYDAPTQTLRYKCTNKHFYETCPEIDAAIAKLVQQAKTGI